MFGYKKGELEGKNVSILMPSPFNQRHNGYLRNYITTGVCGGGSRPGQARGRQLGQARPGWGLQELHHLWQFDYVTMFFSGRQRRQQVGHQERRHSPNVVIFFYGIARGG